MLSMVPSSTLVKLYSPWSDAMPPRDNGCLSQRTDGLLQALGSLS